MARFRLALAALATLTASACAPRADNCADVTVGATPGFTGSMVNDLGDDNIGNLTINDQPIAVDFVDTTADTAGGLEPHYTTRSHADAEQETLIGNDSLVTYLRDTQGITTEQAEGLTAVLDTHMDDINTGFEEGYNFGVANVAVATGALNERLANIGRDHPAQHGFAQRQCRAPDTVESVTPAGYEGTGYYIAEPEQTGDSNNSPWLAALVAGLGGAFAFFAYKKKQNFTFDTDVTASLNNKTHSVVILRNDNKTKETDANAYWILTQADDADPAKAGKAKVKLFSTNAAGRDTIIAAGKDYAMHPKLIKDFGNVLGKKGTSIGALGSVVREGPVVRALEAVEVPESSGNAMRVVKAAVNQLKHFTN